MNFTFGADKRLKSRKGIEQLFIEGKKLHRFPVTAVYTVEESEKPSFQIAVSVPKKRLNKASDRNTIKRKLREAVRLNQHKLSFPAKINLMLIYTTDEKLDYKQVEQSVIALFALLNSIANDQIVKK